MSQAALTPPPIILLPTEDDLPYDDGIPMETPRHRAQMEVLINALDSWLEGRDNGFVGGNMFVYFSAEQVRDRDFRGPDFFVVLGVPKRERKSWIVWQESKAPDVIIELLSSSTALFDKNEKKLIYQNQLRASEYFWFDPDNPADWEGFILDGGVYQPIPLNEQGHRISRSLELALVRWQGSYRGVYTTWLRWATLDGELLPLPQELAEQAQERAEQAQELAEQATELAEAEHQRAEQARELAEQARELAEAEHQRAEQAERERKAAIPKLLAMGLTAAQVAEALNLPIEAIEQ
ncbi:Uma2 family endonuclease [Oscillatoria sp. FACHB-1406]|uniref:Uma2 family endonuclease n=1 Tax=Oscillatoria sp. FACHB-1406 TaxID=2692846 RepID=UPI001684C0D1|nr:Uma2 family endonuclease [Oscillatoria sp. FACHB-1406]MBD2576521.1 Uma2 family endonuclease [Oscillatoria sp. FACHB-1406]